jgi:hypothetical protein
VSRVAAQRDEQLVKRDLGFCRKSGYGRHEVCSTRRRGQSEDADSFKSILGEMPSVRGAPFVLDYHRT